MQVTFFKPHSYDQSKYVKSVKWDCHIGRSSTGEVLMEAEGNYIVRGVESPGNVIVLSVEAKTLRRTN
jgi:hypothetical protein